MQKVLLADEMRSVDRLTTERCGISPQILMESAANATARVIAEKLDGVIAGKSVMVICGRGNNGGDGAALGRILWTMGADVEVCLIGQSDGADGAAAENFAILKRLTERERFDGRMADLAFEEILSLEEWLEYESFNSQCGDPDVIVDALFGTGLTRPLDGVFEQAAAFISSVCQRCGSGDSLVISIDLPSGLIADSATLQGAAVSADATVTFTAPKLANVMPPAAECAGELYVANIGSPIELIDDAASQTYVAEPDDAAAWLTKAEFRHDSYKNRRGHALLVAGSSNYSGAAVLSAAAAIRSGVGLATAATPKSCVSLIASRVTPEVMVRGIAETLNGAASGAAFGEINEFIENVDCLAVGSGLSSSEEETRQLVKRLVIERRTPVIIDADGLNALSPFDLTGSGRHPLVLTPHDGEFLRLIGSDDKKVLDDRVAAARKFAVDHNVILVLKGPRAVIAEPSGRVVIIPTGNSGLGKAGNGDTLCGLIAGFVAQAVQLKIDLFETVIAAVYFGGLAGDIAEKKFGKNAMTASDVRDCFADAFDLLGC